MCVVRIFLFLATKKQIKSSNCVSEITYSKLGKYGYAGESGSSRSSMSRKDSILTERVSVADKNFIRSTSTVHNEENDTLQNTGHGLFEEVII